MGKVERLENALVPMSDCIDKHTSAYVMLICF